MRAKCFYSHLTPLSISDSTCISLSLISTFPHANAQDDMTMPGLTAALATMLLSVTRAELVLEVPTFKKARASPALSANLSCALNTPAYKRCGVRLRSASAHLMLLAGRSRYSSRRAVQICRAELFPGDDGAQRTRKRQPYAELDLGGHWR